MNYRHAFHAGNFADCHKHAVLTWLLRALQRKSAPLFVLDTHAGAGAYALDSGAAKRSEEWRAGIGRLLDDPPPALADYVGLVNRIGLYPGSPAIAKALCRPADRLVCCELHPEEHAALRRRFARDRQVAVHHRDGWEALGALLPPAERRGLVLIDPPYEQPDEFARLATELRVGHSRFRGGVFVAWYPIKHGTPVHAFQAAIKSRGIADIVVTELLLRAPLDPSRLNGSGLLVINPPYRFEEEVPPIVAALLDRLGTREPGEAVIVKRLADE
ncbi:MAG: 23S rRNA (adenine(2030)-N(6))-methyltransferase RlmJ [Acetobacteraceae bacterium]